MVGDRSYNRLVKVLALASFLLMTLALVSISGDPRASSFEASIYEGLPWFFWVGVMGAILLGQLSLLAYILGNMKGRPWAYGLTAVAVANLVFQMVPLIRGYTIYGRGDVLSHIGWMKDITTTGFVGRTDVYPLEHVLGVSINSISGLSLGEVSFLVPLLFAILFDVAFLLLAKGMRRQTGEILFIMIFVFTPIFGSIGVLFAPFNQAVLLFPLALYLFFKGSQVNCHPGFRVAFVAVLVIIVFIHPLTALFTIAMLLVLGLSYTLAKRWRERPLHGFEMSHLTNSAIIAAVVFFMWPAYALLLEKNIVKVYNSLFQDTSELSRYSEMIEYASPGLADLITLFLYSYGHIIVLAVLSLIAIAYLIKLFRNPRTKGQLDIHHLYSSLGFLFFGALAAACLVLPFVVGSGRVLVVAAFFSLILVPLAFYKMVTGGNRRLAKASVAVVCLAMVFIIYFATFNMFLAPQLKTSNEQVTATDMVGMEAFFSVRSQDYTIMELGPIQKRYYDAIYGVQTKRVNVSNTLGYVMRPIDHFGYDQNSSIGVSYERPTYFLLSDVGRTLYPEVYPEIEDKWRFTANDFNRLRTADPLVDLVYNNGNLEAYFIYG